MTSPGGDIGLPIDPPGPPWEAERPRRFLTVGAAKTTTGFTHRLGPLTPHPGAYVAIKFCYIWEPPKMPGISQAPEKSMMYHSRLGPQLADRRLQGACPVCLAADWARQ